MIPIPINEAEAIFAPFFDGGDSDMRTDKACLLDEFDVRPGAGCAARAEQTWCSVDVVIDRAPVGTPALTLTCRTPLAIAGYDVFRVFACQPPYVRLRIAGRMDGREAVILDDHHRPVNLVRLVSAKATTHRLLTVLELLPEGAAAGRWRIAAEKGGVRVERGDVTLAYDIVADGRACVRLCRGSAEHVYGAQTGWVRE